MTRLVSLPHLQTDAVSTSAWSLTVRGKTQEVPALLNGWDYTTALHFDSEVEIDRRRVLADCGLGEGSTVVAVAVWWASSTNRREVAPVEEVGESGRCRLSFDVDPAVAGGVLTLRRHLLLGSASAPSSPFSPTQPGSLLWEEDRTEITTMILEGEAPRFPTEVLDFAGEPVFQPSAAWWLSCRLEDLDASPLGRLRLYVNSANPRVKQLLSGATDPETTLAGSVMTWDVGRRMIDAALDSVDFVDGWGTFRPGSLGEVLELLIRKVWPGEDAAGLRAARAEDRGLFEARMQGAFEALGGRP